MDCLSFFLFLFISLCALAHNDVFPTFSSYLLTFSSQSLTLTLTLTLTSLRHSMHMHNCSIMVENEVFNNADDAEAATRLGDMRLKFAELKKVGLVLLAFAIITTYYHLVTSL